MAKTAMIACFLQSHLRKNSKKRAAFNNYSFISTFRFVLQHTMEVEISLFYRHFDLHRYLYGEACVFKHKTSEVIAISSFPMSWISTKFLSELFRSDHRHSLFFRISP